MKGFITALLCVALVACSETKTKVTGWAGGGLPIGEFTSRNWVYGKSQIDSTIFGVTHITNLDIGFKAFAQLVTTLAGAIAWGKVQLAAETTKQLANAGLTQVQITKLNNALTESISKNGLDATIAGINGGLFTPEGTVFSQPKL